MLSKTMECILRLMKGHGPQTIRELHARYPGGVSEAHLGQELRTLWAEGYVDRHRSNTVAHYYRLSRKGLRYMRAHGLEAIRAPEGHGA